MLTFNQWGAVAFTRRQINKIHSRYQLLKCGGKLQIWNKIDFFFNTRANKLQSETEIMWWFLSEKYYHHSSYPETVARTLYPLWADFWKDRQCLFRFRFNIIHIHNTDRVAVHDQTQKTPLNAMSIFSKFSPNLYRVIRFSKTFTRDTHSSALRVRYGVSFLSSWSDLHPVFVIIKLYVISCYNRLRGWRNIILITVFLWMFFFHSKSDWFLKFATVKFCAIL